MKNFSTSLNLIAIIGIVASLAGCQTAASNSAAISTSQKEMLLTQSGFRAKTVTTPKQQEQVAKLAIDVVSAVKYKGNLYYVFPTGAKDQILVGKQPQFDNYKKALGAQQTKSSGATATTQAEREAEAHQDMYGPVLTGETAGPTRVSVEVFDGFGPMWP